MRRVPTLFLFLLLLAALCCGRLASASSDFYCTQTWKLVHRTIEGCGNQGLLAPANDTRVNLLLLMADLHAARYATAFAATQPQERQESPLFPADDLAWRFSGALAPNDPSSSADADVQADRDKCPTTLDLADGFVVAVKADSALRPEEREALLAARLVLRCKENKKTKTLADAAGMATTPAGQAFTAYLTAANLFWQGAYPEAAAAFAPLAKADSPWLKETALYMLGRVAINRAQEGAFDPYGEMNRDWKPDPKLLADAVTALDTYIQTYPKGMYAQSARGLKRRAWWLGGMQDRLVAEYDALMTMDPGDRNVNDPELAWEIDNKLLLTIYDPQRADAPAPKWDALAQTPFLLAVLDLQRMRKAEISGSETSSDSATGNTITRAELEAQKPFFAGQPALYGYLLAAYAFYVEDQPAEALRLIPETARQDSFTYLEFSRQMLRGVALAVMKDRNALDFWLRMLPGSAMPFQRPALELAIALHHERAGTVSKVFEADSPIRYPYLRQALLLYSADAALLRKQAKNTDVSRRERDQALFALLYKEATRGHAADFLKDLALAPAGAPVGDHIGPMAPDGSADAIWSESEKQAVPLGIFQRTIAGEYDCPSLVAVQTRLVKEPRDPKSLLCVSDFVRRNSWVVSGLDHPPPADELGGGPSRFAGQPHARMATYQSILADPKAGADHKAYALYRAIRCYAPGGASDCGGADVPVDQRQAWFLRLKKEYPSSRWAKELKYYW